MTDSGGATCHGQRGGWIMWLTRSVLSPGASQHPTHPFTGLQPLLANRRPQLYGFSSRYRNMHQVHDCSTQDVCSVVCSYPPSTLKCRHSGICIPWDIKLIIWLWVDAVIKWQPSQGTLYKKSSHFTHRAQRYTCYKLLSVSNEYKLLFLIRGVESVGFFRSETNGRLRKPICLSPRAAGACHCMGRLAQVTY